MARVLHFPTDGETIHASFAALQTSLGEMPAKSAKIAQQSKNRGGPSEPITLSIANHLFAQTGYDFRDPFRELVKKFYGAPFETLDFKATRKPHGHTSINGSPSKPATRSAI